MLVASAVVSGPRSCARAAQRHQRLGVHRDVDLSTTAHRIEINLAERMLRAYDDTTLIVETPVVVGTAFTPTPTGTFFITDIVPQKSPSYGPVALATDGYSEMMDEFDTGVPVVALHGTNAPRTPRPGALQRLHPGAQRGDPAAGRHGAGGHPGLRLPLTAIG